MHHGFPTCGGQKDHKSAQNLWLFVIRLSFELCNSLSLSSQSSPSYHLSLPMATLKRSLLMERPTPAPFLQTLPARPTMHPAPFARSLILAPSKARPTRT
jgi:hypothetical protein